MSLAISLNNSCKLWNPLKVNSGCEVLFCGVVPNIGRFYKNVNLVLLCEFLSMITLLIENKWSVLVYMAVLSNTSRSIWLIKSLKMFFISTFLWLFWNQDSEIEMVPNVGIQTNKQTQFISEHPECWNPKSTHHVDTQVLPSCLAAVAEVVVAVVVVGRFPIPAVKKRRMKRTWRRMMKSRVEERTAGTGSSGWERLTGSSGSREGVETFNNCVEN